MELTPIFASEPPELSNPSPPVNAGSAPLDAFSHPLDLEGHLREVEDQPKALGAPMPGSELDTPLPRWSSTFSCLALR